MTIKLSQHAGGGEIYNPVMMKYDGSTGYYSNAAVTASNSNITLIMRVNINSFADASADRILHQNSGGARLYVTAFASNYSDNRQDRIGFYITNSAGTVICDIATETLVIDGNNHTIFFSYEGATGNYILKVDGIDNDYLSYTGRVAPVSATLKTGSGIVTIGADTGSVNNITGSFGYFGLSDTYITNWQDFMDSNGDLRQLDETTWTEWGSQPLIWNAHGFLEDNKGSASDMTKTGTIDLSGSNSLQQVNLGLNTIGDAVASDIADGKIAWVNGERIVGTAV